MRMHEYTSTILAITSSERQSAIQIEAYLEVNAATTAKNVGASTRFPMAQARIRASYKRTYGTMLRLPRR